MQSIHDVLFQWYITMIIMDIIWYVNLHFYITMFMAMPPFSDTPGTVRHVSPQGPAQTRLLHDGWQLRVAELWEMIRL